MCADILMPSRNLAVGIDLGGSHIAAALVSSQGKIKYKKTIFFTKLPNGKQGLILIKQLITDILSRVSGDYLTGIGLALPGCVDYKRGVVLADSPNLPPWKGTRVKEVLTKTFKIPVLVDNDANLAAWGEKQWGAGKKSRNLICLTLGTGVGGGIIIDNEIYRGSHWYAGEIGHMTILAGGPVCSCGKRGHLESLVSGTAIVKQYNLRTLKHCNTAKEVFNKARNGDKIARAVVHQTVRFLGLAIASLVNIFDPEVVVIGGGVAKAGTILFNPLPQVVNANIRLHPYRKPRILPARLGENAGLLGAAAIIFSLIK